jgi:hypothetical protein
LKTPARFSVEGREVIESFAGADDDKAASTTASEENDEDKRRWCTSTHGVFIQFFRRENEHS